MYFCYNNLKTTAFNPSKYDSCDIITPGLHGFYKEELSDTVVTKQRASGCEQSSRAGLFQRVLAERIWVPSPVTEI